MTRLEFRQALVDLDLSHRSAEEPFRRMMVELLDSTPDCFVRSSFPAHFTGSALVVSSDHQLVLLHHHRKLNRWLQFGGHCDGDGDVLRVAQREAHEESGIPGLVTASDHPLDLDIHEIPAHGSEPVHFHYDVRYLLIAPEGAEGVVSAESHELRWFTLEEMRTLPLEESLKRLVEKWQAVLELRRSHVS